MRCPVSFEFPMSRVALLEKQEIPDLKNKHKSLAIFQPFDDSRIWKESQTYGISSKSDIGLSAFNFVYASYILAQVLLSGS